MRWENQYKGSSLWTKVFQDYEKGKITNVASYCAQIGISPQRFYKRRKRWVAGGIGFASEIKKRKGSIERKDEIVQYLIENQDEYYKVTKEEIDGIHKILLQRGYKISKSSIRLILLGINSGISMAMLEEKEQKALNTEKKMRKKGGNYRTYMRSNR